MGFAKFGGFVFSTTERTYLETAREDIDKKTFEEIAKILGVHKAVRETLMKEPPRSIHIYFGGKVDSGDGGSGSGGSGSGGSGSGGSGSGGSGSGG